MTVTVPHLTRPGALPPPPPLKKIAFEEHFLVPEALKKNPDGSIDQEDFNFHAANNGLTPQWFKQIYDRLMDFNETRIQSMNESNIAYSILSLMCPGIGAVTNKQKAEDMARAVNDALAEKISEHPDRFGGFASLAIHDADKAAKELERCVKKLGFHGVLFNGYYQVDRDDNLIYLDEDRCAPIWAAMEELDVPLYLHPRTSYQQLMYKGHQELICANWGYACETGTHAVRILVGGVFDRFPKAKMILGHNGENIPFSAWRLQHWMEFNPGDDRPKKRIQDYLRDNVYTTISGDWSVPALLCTMQVMGTDRILNLGSSGWPIIACICGLTVSGTGITRAGTSRVPADWATVPSSVVIVAMESSPVVPASVADSVIDLETAAAGNVLIANDAVPAINISRLVVNLATHPLRGCDSWSKSLFPEFTSPTVAHPIRFEATLLPDRQ